MSGIVNYYVGNTSTHLHIEMYYQSMCIYSPDILLLLRFLPALHLMLSLTVAFCSFGSTHWPRHLRASLSGTGLTTAASV